MNSAYLEEACGIIILFENFFKEKRKINLNKFFAFLIQEKENIYKLNENKFNNTIDLTQNTLFSYSKIIGDCLNTIKILIKLFPTIEDPVKKEVFNFINKVENVNYHFEIFENNFYNLFEKNQR